MIDKKALAEQIKAMLEDAPKPIVLPAKPAKKPYNDTEHNRRVK